MDLDFQKDFSKKPKWDWALVAAFLVVFGIVVCGIAGAFGDSTVLIK